MMIGSGEIISNNMNNKNYRIEATLCWISENEPHDNIFIKFRKIRSKESRGLAVLDYYIKKDGKIEPIEGILSQLLSVCIDLHVDKIHINFSYDLWKHTKDMINKFSYCTGIEICYWEIF